MKALVIIVCTLVAVVGGIILFVLQPGPSGVAASLRLPDGSEYMVTQKFNWSAEPYTVAFYMRSPGEPWGWCYIDHEAMRWHGVSMSYDPETDIVTVTERGTWQAALDRKRRMFSIGDGKPRREVPAPQENRQPEFEFP